MQYVYMLRTDRFLPFPSSSFGLERGKDFDSGRVIAVADDVG
jgi:hypothetical protein